MKLRYELVDMENPTWRGERFSTIERGQQELRASFPPGRFVLYDRLTGDPVSARLTSDE